MSLQHLHLHVRDRAVAEAFYAQWFGLRTQRRGETITFMLDDRDFLFALMHDADPAPMPPWFHFGMKQPSAQAVKVLLDRMTDANVPLVKGLYEDEALVSFRCADPDGYAIEVYWEAQA